MASIPRAYLFLLPVLVAIKGGYAQFSYCSYLYRYSCRQACEPGEDEFLSRVRLCHSGTCCKPGPAVWSDWSPWGRCSVTCGSGSRIRTRACSGGSCPTYTENETSACNTWNCSQTNLECRRNSLSRILSGEATGACRYPWMVNFALYALGSGLYGNSCGGVLLSNAAVLTQTACVEKMLPFATSSDEFSLVAVVGDHRPDKWDEHQQSRLVTTDLTLSSGELTIMRLEPPVRFTDCVAPVCLPEVNTAFSDECRVAGWGQTDPNSPWSDVLLDHNVTLMSTEACDAVFRFLQNETLPAGFLCTDTKKDGAAMCNGDQGGMLVCDDETSESLVLAGITSSTACTVNTPSTYTDVIPYLDWIRDTLEKI